MNNYKRLLVMLLVATSLFLTACNDNSKSNEKDREAKGEEPKQEKSIEIKDELGTVQLKDKPKNIVVLEYSFADAVKNLGSTPIGIADDNKKEIIKKLYGEEVKYTSVGTRKQPNLETISSLKPDLIIADVQRHKGIYEDLKKIAPTMILKSREASFDDVNASFEKVATAMGKEDEGKKMLNDLEAKLNEAKSKNEKGSNKDEKVMIAVAREDAFQAHTSYSYVGQLLEKIGMKNAIESNNAYEEVNLETLSKINPDKLIITSDKDKPITDEWKNKELWKELNAYKKDQIQEVDRDYWTRFRGFKANEYIMKDVEKNNE